MRIAHLFLALGLFAAASNTARSCEYSDEAVALRDLIYADDVSGVESALTAHQADYEAGTLDVTEMRCIFYHFARSRPETIDFIDAWLAQFPNSAFAMAAKATTLFKHSWNIRGDKPARTTHPDAMATFKRMQHDDIVTVMPQVIQPSQNIVHI